MSQTGKKGRLRVVKKPKIDAVRNEINVTPLVDVCLVLLIIFMVILPMLQRGKDVRLPQTSAHEEVNDEQQPIVAIDAKGQIYFDKEIVTIEDLPNRVEHAWSVNEARPVEGNIPERRVYLKADDSIRYEKVYPVIMKLHELGIPGVDLGTNERKEPDE